MAITERQGITGRLTILVKDTAGNVIDRRQVENVITDVGKNLIASYFTGAIQATPSLTIAVGSNGDSEPSASDTALGAYLDEAIAETEVIDHKASVTATLPVRQDGDVQELKEAGIRVAIPGRADPILYNRVTFPVVNRSPNMEMTLTWEVTF